jgi:hypothetical protein
MTIRSGAQDASTATQNQELFAKKRRYGRISLFGSAAGATSL